MALILSLREGHTFYVEGRRVVVSHIASALDFNLKNDVGEIFNIREVGWTEIMPDVEVQAAIPRDQVGNIVRVAIKADGKKILRGDLVEKSHHRRRRLDVCHTCSGLGKLTTKKLCSSCGGHGCSHCKGGYVEESFNCPDC